MTLGLALLYCRLTSLVLNGSWVTDTGLAHLTGAKFAPGNSHHMFVRFQNLHGVFLLCF